VHQTAFSIDADMRFHAAAPYVSFLCPVYVFIALVVAILGRRRHVNDGRVDYGGRSDEQMLSSDGVVNGDEDMLGNFIHLE